MIDVCRRASNGCERLMNGRPLPSNPVDHDIRGRRGFLARYNAVEAYQERTTVAHGQAQDKIALDQQALLSSISPRQISIGCIACALT